MSYTVLIVDESRLVIDIVKMRLELHGYRVRTAQNGPDALAKIDAAVPDLVVLNGQMPGMDGYEVARQVRANPALKDLRVMLLTSPSDERAGGADGVDDYLNKELELLDLPSRVQRLLGD